MAETLQLVLSARVRDLVTNLQQAGAAVDNFRKRIEGLESQVASALGQVNTQVKAFGTGLAGGFKQAATAAKDASKTVETSAANMSQALRGVGNNATGGIRTAAKEIKSLDQVVGGASKRVSDGLLTMRTAFLGLGAGAGIKAIVSNASDFGKAVAYVGTVLDGTATVSIERYRQQLIDLGGRTTQDAVERSRTLYQILSSGIPAVEGVAGAGATLETSLRAATAGMANAEDAAKAITGTMNAYKESNVTAARASDVLFQVVNRGVVEFPELSRLFGQVSGVAASLGVALPEVGGAIATITKAGIPAESAVSGLRQALLSIAKPPEEVQKRLQALGIEFSATALAEKSFAGVLQEVIDKTGGSSEVLTKLFTDVDGLKAVLALTRGGLSGFKTDIEAVGNSAGATDRAFGILSNTFDFQAGVLKNKLQTLLINIGDRVLPQLQEAFASLGKFVTVNQDEIASAIGSVLGALVSVGQWIASHGVAVLAFFVTTFAATKITAAAQALVGFANQLKTVAAAAAVAGTASGSGFASSFGKGAGGIVGGLMKLLGGLAKSPTIIGVVVSVGIELASAMIGAFKDQAAERFEEVKREFRAQFAQFIIPAVEQKVQFARGELVSFAKGGKFEAASVFTPESARKEGIDDQTILNAAIETESALRRDVAATVKKIRESEAALQAAIVRRAEAEEVGSLAGVAGAQARIDTAKEDIRNQQALRDAYAEGVDTIVSGTRTKLDALNAVAKGDADAARKSADAAKKLGGLSEEAKKAEQRREQVAKELGKIRDELTKSAVEGAQEEQEARAAAYDAETQALEDLARLRGAGEVELADLQLDRFQQARTGIQGEIEQVRAAADAKIELARREFERVEAEFADSQEVRLAAAQHYIEERGRAEAEAEAASLKIRTDNEHEVAQLRLSLIKSLSGATAALSTGAGGGGAAGTAASTGFLKQIEAVGDKLRDPIAALEGSSSALLSGTGVLLKALINLPQILDGAAALLRDGVANWLDGVADGAADVLDAFVNELPKQVERIFGEIIPRIIQGIIGATPQIIAEFTLHMPKIAAAIIKSIPAIVASFGRGLADAARDVFGSIPQSIKDAFSSAVGAQVEALGAAFKDAARWIYEAIRDGIVAAVKAVGGAISGILPDFGNARANRIAGATVGATIGGVVGGPVGAAVGGAIGGGYDEVRGWFHRGGVVRSALENHGAAVQLAAAGAQRFGFGGMVSQPGAMARGRIAAALSRDTIPILARDGEGVLNREHGMPAIGGEAGLAAANRGQAPAGAGMALEVVLGARSGAERSLMQLIVGTVRVSVKDPLGGVRQALDAGQRQGPPLLSSYVHRR